MLDKEEWCIVRYHNTSPDRKRDYDLIVRKVYQWDAQNLRSNWEYVARGFKSNEEALQWVNLFKE